MSPRNIKFSDFGLNPLIQKTLDKQNYKTPTHIQELAIPVLKDGRDVIGTAQTGTGKTAAFALPFIDKIAEFTPSPIPYKPLALALAPTRELAEQIADSFKTYGRNINLKVAVAFGGVKHQKQIKTLKDGVHVLVATPGRFLDLYDQDMINLDYVSYFVIDEADRMLDMGFMPDIEKIISNLPKKYQTALFSATMPPQISFMAQKIMADPVELKTFDSSLAGKNIDQRVLFVESKNKSQLLLDVIQGNKMKRVIVFGRTKKAVDREAELLSEAGVKVGIIHGDKFQRDRQKVIKRFAAGEIDVLFATDVASRGLDIENVSHVINFNVPDSPDDYVHRIGRTARAGKKGIALTFCCYPERKLVSNIEHYINLRISIFRGHKYHAMDIEKANMQKPAKTKNQRSASGQGKHRRVAKDRTPAGAKRRGQKPSLKPQGKEERVTLAQAKQMRKKMKKNDQKQQKIANRLKKYYRD